MTLTLAFSGCGIFDFGIMPGASDTSGTSDTSEAGNNMPTISIESEKEPERKVITIYNDNSNYILSSEVAEEEAEYVEIHDDENKIYSRMAAGRNEVVMRFAGDVCFYDGFSLMAKYREFGSDIDNCIDASLLDLMRSADIFMLNNEFPYSDRGAPLEEKTYAFRSKPENVEILNDMGVDIVSLANNHAYDWGPDALSDSFEVLRGAGIPYVGAGNNISEAMMPAYFKVNGITISFVSATQIERFGNPDTKEATETSPGVLRTLDPKKACRVIEAASENSDFTVMYVHWGSENTDLVEGSQRDLAKAYVEAGADLIIGDHSHCLQGIDYVDGVPVFYSLGNYWFNSKRVDTGLAEIILDVKDSNAKIKTMRFIPAIQREYKTREVDEADKRRILSYLQGISNYAEIDISTGMVVQSDTDHNTQNGINTSPTKKIKTPAPAEDAGNAENSGTGE